MTDSRTSNQRVQDGTPPEWADPQDWIDYYRNLSQQQQAEIERLRAALRKIASGKTWLTPAPIGWEAAYAREVLNSAPPDSAKGSL